jgi:hypothetical protein
MQPAFYKTLKNVCIPIGSRIISPIPREDNLVRSSSFGDRFVEGIYFHTALAGPIPSSTFSTCTTRRNSWSRISLPILQNFHSRTHLP